MPYVSVDQRRSQLIEAAIRVIGRQGIAGASTRRIAFEAGASQTSLHYSFRSKEELFAAVTEHAVRLAEQAIAARAIPAGVGLRVAVCELLTLFSGWTATDPALQVAQFELNSWALRTATHRDLADSCYRLYEESFGAVLAAAAAPDERDVDFRALARVTIIVTDGMALRVLASGAEALSGVDYLALADALVAGSAPLA